MRRMMIFGLPLLALACIAHADGNVPAPIEFTMGWHVSLAADGHVLHLDPIKDERMDRVPEIRARLEQEIHSWKFLPGSVNGKPAPTETGLYVRATLTDAQNNAIRIRVDSADTGATEKKLVPPHYPADAIRAQKTGEVVLRVGYDVGGNVTSVAPYPDGPKADKALVDASIKAVKGWKFLPESVDGHALAGYSITPFCYSLNYLRGGRKQGKCDWKRPGSDQALLNGEALALNPAAKLLTDVAGHTL